MKPIEIAEFVDQNRTSPTLKDDVLKMVEDILKDKKAVFKVGVIGGPGHVAGNSLALKLASDKSLGLFVDPDWKKAFSARGVIERVLKEHKPTIINIIRPTEKDK